MRHTVVGDVSGSLMYWLHVIVRVRTCVKCTWKAHGCALGCLKPPQALQGELVL